MNLPAELVNNGYVITEATHLLEFVNADTLDFVQTNDDLLENYPAIDELELKQLLEIIHFQIGLEFIDPYATTYQHTKAVLWEGSLPMHKTWHSDIAEVDDVFFLLYFSDQTLTNDGALWVRNPAGEYRIVPTPGTLIGVENTNPEFMHLVEPTVGKRIVGAFGFKVEWKHVPNK